MRPRGYRDTFTRRSRTLRFSHPAVPMDCRSFRKHHVAYLDDLFPGELLVAAERHVRECAACAAHDTAVRLMPKVRSVVSTTFCRAIGCQKLGQPVPDSNFVAES